MTKETQETATTTATAVFTVTLPAKVNMNGPDRKVTPLDISKWPPEMVTYMLVYAHGVRMQRCTANVATSKHLEARQAMWDSMARGEVPSGGGGGGGGSSLTIEQAAWIAFFKSKASSVKFKGKTPNGKNLDDYYAVYVRKAIWPSVQKVLATMDQNTQVEFHKEKLPDLIKKHKDTVLKQAETDPNGIGKFIKAEKLKREGKKPEAPEFHVDIEIDI